MAKDEPFSLARRNVLKKTALGLAVGATTAAGVVTGTSPSPALAAPAIHKGIRQWRMVLTWQKNLPGVGTGATRLANRIHALTDGLIEVKTYGGGELVPPLGVFDAVSQGTAELGHTASYYWTSKARAAAFFCAVPGGLNAYEQDAWIYFSGGLNLWHELYEPFGVIAYPAGNTGSQMGGWFKRELHDVKDLKGLKMRIPGLAGEVMSHLGATPQNIPSQELYTAMQSGVIDALEWIGPWNDLALGFHRVAPYYYGPGLHEAGATLECILNRKAFLGLPTSLQLAIKTACATENQLMQAQYYANNIRAYAKLRDELKVDIRTFPQDIMEQFLRLSEQVVSDIGHSDRISQRIVESFRQFRRTSIAYGKVAEHTYLNIRAKVEAET